MLHAQIEKKEKDRVNKYTGLKYEILKMWKNKIFKVYIDRDGFEKCKYISRDNLAQWIMHVCWEQLEF